MIEYANLIDLQESFFIVNNSNNIADDKNQELYQKYIFEKIKEIYNAYLENEKKVGGPQVYLIKDFIATLLLKFEHRKFLTFRVYGISGIKYRPIFKIEEGVNHAKIGEIFYEFQDRLVTIPVSCIQKYEECTEGKIQQILFDFYTKYQLFSEVSGAHLLEYLRNIKDRIMTSLRKEKAFDSYNNYRNLYFATVFKYNVEFRKKYNIKPSQEIQDLQTILGNFFEKIKVDSAVSEINRLILKDLDQTLYLGINKILAKYNQVFPLKNNSRYLTAVQEDVQKIVKDFYDNNKVRFNEQSQQLMKQSLGLVESWKRTLMEHSWQKNGSYETPGSFFIPAVPSNSDVVFNVVHEPMNMNNMSIPVHSP